MGDGLPTVGGLKRLSSYLAGQLKSAISVTGGAIDGTVIGGTTPAAGTFTTLAATTFSPTSTVSTPVNVTAATLTVTVAAHAGRIITLNKADGQTVTLPAASGTGARFEFVLGTAVTSVGTLIKVANASDAFQGNAYVISDNSAAVLGYAATAGTDDTITLNGTTKGGLVGDRILIEDVATNRFQVSVFTAATGTEATPFSATV